MRKPPSERFWEGKECQSMLEVLNRKFFRWEISCIEARNMAQVERGRLASRCGEGIVFFAYRQPTPNRLHASDSDGIPSFVLEAAEIGGLRRACEML